MACGPFALWSDLWALQHATYTLSDVHLAAVFPSAEDAEQALAPTSLRCVPAGGSLHLFREGIRPVYDDSHHAAGGHFKMQVQTMDLAQHWLPLAKAFMTGRFPHSELVTGVTYMRAHHTRGLKLWLSVSGDRQLLSEIRGTLFALLPRREISNLKFCPHKYVVRKLSTPLSTRSTASSNSDADPSTVTTTSWRCVDPAPRAPCADDSSDSSGSEDPSSCDASSGASEMLHGTTSLDFLPRPPTGLSGCKPFDRAAVFLAEPHQPLAAMGDATPSPLQRIRQKLSTYQLGPDLANEEPVALMSWLIQQRRVAHSPSSTPR